MTDEIRVYYAAQTGEMAAICTRLAGEIGQGLPDAESKVWHGGPVWFLAVDEIDCVTLGIWLGKARDIQWDYKNIVKRKGVLERLVIA
ncbi:MAG: hypothetical protein ABI459_08535 [Deltaproteobacteria bacterium]